MSTKHKVHTYCTLYVWFYIHKRSISCNSQYFGAAKFVDTSKLLDHYLGFVMPEILLHMKKAEYIYW